MRIKVLVVGKTDKAWVKDGMEIYTKRLKRYCTFDWVEIPDIKNAKNLSEAEQKQAEGEKILAKVDASDELVLLDENGKSLTSEKFAKQIEMDQVRGVRNMVFVIGGPYGFSTEVYNRANRKLSLSAMTFSHQMIRVFIIEQIYRAFTIIKGEPYHHR